MHTFSAVSSAVSDSSNEALQLKSLLIAITDGCALSVVQFRCDGVRARACVVWLPFLGIRCWQDLHCEQVCLRRVFRQRTSNCRVSGRTATTRLEPVYTAFRVLSDARVQLRKPREKVHRPLSFFF